MKEVLEIKPSQPRAELTRPSKSPRLDRGVIFMASVDGGAVEQLTAPEQAKLQKVKEKHAEEIDARKTGQTEELTAEEKGKLEDVKKKVTDADKPVDETYPTVEQAKKSLEEIRDPHLKLLTEELLASVEQGAITEKYFSQTLKDYSELTSIIFASEPYVAREEFLLHDARIFRDVFKGQLDGYYAVSPRDPDVKLVLPEQPINVPTAFEETFNATTIAPPKNRELARYMRSFLASVGETPVEQWEGKALLDSYAEFKRVEHKLTESRALSKNSHDRALMKKMEKVLNSGLDSKIKKKEITQKEKEEIKKHPEEIEVKQPPAKPEVAEVQQNAGLSDDDRWTKAQEILRSMGVTQPLTEEHRLAIMDAHNVAKERKEAGVFNYETKELLEKARFLDPYYTPEQQRALMEAGIVGSVPIAPDELSPTGVVNDRQRRALEYVHVEADREAARTGKREVSDNTLQEAYRISSDALQRYVGEDTAAGVDPVFVTEMLNTRDAIYQKLEAAGGDETEIVRSLGMSGILPGEVRQLSRDNGKGAMDWLNGKFDIIYQSSASGQELDSPTLRQLENQVAYALAYLHYQFKGNQEIATNFLNAFTHRQKLMIVRVVIGGRNAESLQGAAQSVGMDGILSSFAFENQNVRRVYQRMNEKLDNMRLNVQTAGFERKVTAEMVGKMRRAIEEEEVRLFQQLRERSPYWELVKDAPIDITKGDRNPKQLAEEYVSAGMSLVEAESRALEEAQWDARFREARNAIRRSERAAYDLFVATQREAIIIARGESTLDPNEGYRSVPSGVFAFFNPEAMMWGGWEMRNDEANLFLDELKRNIADEALLKRGASKNALNDVDKISYGAQLMWDMSPIADIWSGGWRRSVILSQMENLMVFKEISRPKIEEWRTTVRGFGGELTRENIKDLLNGRAVTIKDTAGADRVFDPRTDIEAIRNEFREAYREMDIIRDHMKSRKRITGEEVTFKGTKYEGAINKAHELGLFLQLKGAGDGADEIRGDVHDEHKQHEAHEKREAAKEMWEKIVHTKPEEIIKIIKDRIPVKREGGRWNNELDSLERNIAEHMGIRVDADLERAIKTGDGATPFNLFMEKHEGIISILRENALKEDIPRQVNLAHLDSTKGEIELVDKALGPGSAQKLMKVYEAMQAYIKKHQIQNKLTGKNEHILDLLVNDYRFEHLYNRVQSVDDVLLDEVEEIPQLMRDAGVITTSRILSTDRAGDGYRRVMNDSVDGIKGYQALYNFVKLESPKDKMEHAVAYAEALGSANGQSQIAKALRFTEGSYLVMQRPDYWWDLMGIRQLPFRIPVSTIQRIYGPEAHIMEREEVRQAIEAQLRFRLASSNQYAEHEDMIKYQRGELSEREYKHRKKERLHHSEAMLHSLKRAAGVTREDEIRDTALKISLFFFLWLLGETVKSFEDVASDITGPSKGH